MPSHTVDSPIDDHCQLFKSVKKFGHHFGFYQNPHKFSSSHIFYPIVMKLDTDDLQNMPDTCDHMILLSFKAFSHDRQSNSMAKPPNRKWAHSSSMLWRVATNLGQISLDPVSSAQNNFVAVWPLGGAIIWKKLFFPYISWCVWVRNTIPMAGHTVNSPIECHCQLFKWVKEVGGHFGFIKIQRNFPVATYFTRSSRNLTQMIFRPCLTHLITYFFCRSKHLAITAN